MQLDLRKSRSNALVALFVALFFLVSCDSDTSGNGDSPGTENPNGNSSDNFSLSGIVAAASNSIIDSDTNDEFESPVSNSRFSMAQTIISPMMLGGYVNQKGQGPEGNSKASGDVSDIYRFSFPAKSTITLRIADSDKADLDLYAFPSSCTDGTCSSSNCGRDASAIGANAASVLEGQSEQIFNPADTSAEVFIEVCSVNGASNYTLVTGTLAESSLDVLSMDKDFIPGEILVRFKDSTKDVNNSLITRDGLVGYRGLHKKGGSANRTILLDMGQLENREKVLRKVASKSAVDKRAIVARLGEEVLAKWDTLQAISALRKQEDILFAEPNYLYKLHAVPNDGAYPIQWHYPMINLPAAWDITTGDSSVIVAVIDSGVLLDHPDITEKLVPGFDFLANPENSRDGDGIDSNPNDNGDLGFGERSVFHGSHVAGTIAARTNDGGDNVAGVSWESLIMPLRACGTLGCSEYAIIQSMRYAAGLENDSGTVPEKTADIINLSLGGPGANKSSSQLFQDVFDSGIIIIASAGNGGSNVANFPASYGGVVSVSAVDINRNLATYSDYGEFIDITGPGGDQATGDTNGDGYADLVLSVGGDDSSLPVKFSYPFYQGTSMSAPHVAGVAALMKAANSNLTSQQFDSLLQKGSLTDDLGVTGRDDQFGFGLINAFKAVNAAQNVTLTTPLLSVNPKSISFGALSNRSISVTNAGGGDLNNVTVSPVLTDGVLAVTADSTDSNGLGSYTVHLDRGQLAAGNYSREITVSSSDGQLTVPVQFQVGGITESNVGRQYMLLIDPSTNKVLQTVTAVANKGEYEFRFEDIAKGEYFLISGSDMDNDGTVCDRGESCGRYPFNSLLETILIDKNVQGIEMTSVFDVEIETENTTYLKRKVDLIDSK